MRGKKIINPLDFPLEEKRFSWQNAFLSFLFSVIEYGLIKNYVNIL